uniref:RING-type domain-containing protein n=1 Tax=Panagrolaimus davidi TaxID=227884 RepID=A0A914PRQ5_9BILA
MSSLTLNPKCDICYDIYDQELARAFTAPCGHSICAQCEFRLRISCIKRLILPQCWICMKPFDGPLYRTFALESSIPRFEKQRFQNPYMSNEKILQELISNPELYLDISIQFYEPRNETPESVWDDMDFSPAYRPNVLSPFESITASMPSYSSSPSIVEEQIQEGNFYARDQSTEHRPVVQTQPSMVPIVPRRKNLKGAN